uniref:DNA-directed RNA polymerase subunit alpha n=1 Tax=Leontice armeniaca TaxID=2567863 RepID=A0A4D6E7Y8_9MAGN|nr:RNA polymerase alpha subunit [Leontice armeniaca]YP_010459421.1 RNA polymerase alpha subunit [Gymnospermium albertii]YP_010459508.1 RNA polymerase alpha subunit [Gymnospermium altaicum]YP_010459682.1 RNA polymerase alpha subunit [Gymnospermium odessanum]YP_010459769.1 RNA polymerase alpha subunit [Gymnospermium peloponnesiacum]QBZ77757.1 RNA polymerase alpha subunit [Leontice armeniaca]UUC02819.1 RNA polymerase alpha subunit [Gymnospermium albertii]UUC02906.1 RNA polymerase alpha subunit 
MLRKEVAVSTRTLQWRCVESRTDNKCLYYGRFVLSPLMKGQADMIGIAMRRALLGEIEGTCITHAKSEKIPHEYSTIGGIEESVHEILMNLKEIVLRSNLYGTCDASICVKGPVNITAKDIISPPSVEIVDTTQHIASLTEPIDLCIGLQIERNRGYRMKTPNSAQKGSYPIDAVFMPVRNANHSIHSYGNGNEKQEILFLEIWTNGSLTPKEALHEASRNLIDLFIPFLHAEEQDIFLEDNQNRVTLPLFTFHDGLAKLKKNEIALKCIFIDQSELPSRTYNCLKKSNINTLLDLLNKSQEDLLKIEHFRIEDVKRILGILQKRFVIDLPKNKFSI